MLSGQNDYIRSLLAKSYGIRQRRRSVNAVEAHNPRREWYDRSGLRENQEVEEGSSRLDLA